MLYIDAARVYTPDAVIEDGAILIDGKRILAVGPRREVPRPETAAVLDAAGLSVVPGFIDLQLNGAFGDDFTIAPETIWRVAAQLPQYGVTAFLPTIITSPLAQVGKAQEVLSTGPQPGWQGAIPLGLHCEGPFLNPQKKGAHNPRHLRQPTLEDVASWSVANHVRLVTLAPELPGALDLIRTLAARGVLISAGHSMATYQAAEAGFAAGARYGTHLFNAMPPLEHREPGLAGALLTDPRQTIGIIPDGIHTHPAVVALAWAAKGPDHLNVVTDAMAALGNPPGRYMLSDQEVIVTTRDARLPSGSLAGSILAMDTALRNLIAFTGCTLADALRTITTVPAGLLGLGSERGHIRPDAIADLVFLTPELAVVRTMVEGATVFTRPV